MTWVSPLYSRSQIDKKGKKLIDPNATQEEYEEAMEVLSNWRASHALPLHYMQSWLRKELSRDRTSLVTQRLKRVPSIKRKLEKLSSNLTQIQDIGGCRAIVKDIDTLYQVKDLLAIRNRRQHELIKENDYLINPPKSGYRGVHLIYKHGGEDERYKKHRIELQLRTNIQHYWATSVEIIGTFTGQNLKGGEGESDWLEFFELTSMIFAYLENYVPNDIKDFQLTIVASEVKRLIDKLNVVDMMEAFPLTIQHNLEKEINTPKYFLLILNVKEESIQGEIYTPAKFKKAIEHYKKLEKDYRDNHYVNIVLVKSESIKKLKRGYPNYFANSKSFLECLKKGLESIS